MRLASKEKQSKTKTNMVCTFMPEKCDMHRKEKRQKKTYIKVNIIKKD